MDKRFGGPEFEHEKFMDDPAAQHEMFPDQNFPPHPYKGKSEDVPVDRTPNNPDLFFEYKLASGLALVAEVYQLGQYYDPDTNSIGVNGYVLAFDHNGALIWEWEGPEESPIYPNYIKRGSETLVFRYKKLDEMLNVASMVEGTNYYKEMSGRLAA